ncbi:type II toxin-antitoxin system VapC family toxin [Aquamicrobium sp. LC103]|uniref:PIN domain-containing protein n=1 Tax=Aquamicrobium sp. LC103 TaxID=1120658 RepID=UPI00063ECAFE|nr:type II toxin-antitoxin system VapC family toxin [Aquamicrobium sp. LC103]TKT75388.1 type II toxin-antitoxin system VapC family toxin [Aquamicrobium sp. LC103]
MAKVVLDASAVIALLRDEPGADIIGKQVDDAAISAVNLHEVVKELLANGIDMPIAREIIAELHLDVQPHTAEDAFEAAQLATATREHGSGLGDRSCMALAIKLGVPALTTDQAWLDIAGLDVRLVR